VTVPDRLRYGELSKTRKFTQTKECPMASVALVANVLRHAAMAVELTDVSIVQAVDVAMALLGTSDTNVFCDAIEAINATADTGRERRGDRLRAAAAAVSAA
jgi:hypothetical protein